MKNDLNAFINEHFVERKNTFSSKWDNLPARFEGDDDLLAMWVADMDFSTAKGIKNALIDRINHGAFGYSIIFDEYYQNFFEWMRKYHDVHLEKEMIRFDFGVVNSIYHLVNIFTEINDAILIMSPVYYPFANSVKDNFRKLIEHDLLYDGTTFSIDYEKLEQDIVKNKVKMCIFCSPHNPISRIWDEDELKKCFDIFKKHNVLIICDEIHQDFAFSKKFKSALNLKDDYSDILIVLNAASKTFNLASLLNSHIIIKDKNLMKKYDDFAKRFNKSSLNILGLIATSQAYKNARYWLENIKQIVQFNYELIKSELKHRQISICPLEGTYLAFLNLNREIHHSKTKEFIQKDCKIAIDYGDWFGANYAGFIRINLATHPDYIKECTKRINFWLDAKDYK